MKRLELLAVDGIPEVHPGDDLGLLLMKGLHDSAIELHDHDIVVVAHKIVSKAEGRIRRLEDVYPSPLAVSWAARYQLDPAQVQVVLEESARIVRMDRGVLISQTRHGFVCANAGVDASNAPAGCVILLPEDPDASARRLRRALSAASGAGVAVIITDTWGRPWRLGIVNFAIGASGIDVFADHRGRQDSAGRSLQSTLVATADELAAAAEMVMGKTSGVPAVVIRGFVGNGTGEVERGARSLVRDQEQDLFR